jgi:TonB family protein
MKACLIYFLFYFVLQAAFGQDTTSADQNDYPVDTLSGKPIYTSVDVNPTFPGGRKNLIRYLNKNLKYPFKARNQKIEGRVIVQFVVDRYGLIRNVTVVDGVEETLDAEATRVISEMPPWNPATKNGENVNVYLILPVSFYISESN